MALTKSELELYILEKELAKRRATKSLAYFSKIMWNVIEPGVKYQHNWHIDAISEHLEAVTKNEIKNLIINIPPRFMKSILVAVMWPAWVWTFKPNARWLFASYSHTLSKRDSIKCRSIIESKWYRDLFLPEWVLASDQNEKMRFLNSAQGYRVATSVGGSGTGEGGDFVCVDDPHKAMDALSDVKRKNVIDWWVQEMSTRGNNPKSSHKVIIMQRLHEKDLTGAMLETKEYELLKIPAEFEPEKRYYTKLEWTDPREDKNELLWPARFGRKELDALKKSLGSQAASGQLQQEPTPSEGGLFKRRWWQYYSEMPQGITRIVQFMDCAQKVGITNDYSVCATWGETPSGYFILDLWRGKVEAPELEITTIAQYNKWKPSALVIEDKSSGSSLIQTLRRKTKLPVIPYDPKKRDKQVRAAAATPTIEAGKVFLPRSASWLSDFIEEHERFPLTDHDDIVDTTSMAVEYFATKRKPSYRIRQL